MTDGGGMNSDSDNHDTPDDSDSHDTPDDSDSHDTPDDSDSDSDSHDTPEEVAYEDYNEDEDCSEGEHMTIPIYPGSDVTVFGAYSLLMEFKRRCKIPFSTMVVLLHLLQILCPLGNLLPTTKYQLVKFAKQSSPHSRLDFCRTCGTELRQSRTCPSSSCPKTEPNTMLIISPDKALQQIISG